MFTVYLKDGTYLTFNGKCNKISDDISGCISFKYYNDNEFVTLEVIPIANIDRIINMNSDEYIKKMEEK